MSDKKQSKTAQSQKSQPRPTRPLNLHVPEPAVRPGGKPDFSSVPIAEAGSVIASGDPMVTMGKTSRNRGSTTAVSRQ